MFESRAQSAGASIFQQNCAVCHSLSPGINAPGPSLFDIAGRNAAGGSFPYSEALKAKARSALVWNDATLKEWVLAPSGLVPGTSMGFAGLQSSEEAEALIAFIKSNP